MPEKKQSAEATYDPRWRTYAAMLAVGTFAVGTDAFVVAGVLPSIAGSLQIGIARAGQLVTVFALAYACAAPFVGALTAGWPLRRTVLVALAVFTVGNALTAVAPTYSTVLASRVVVRSFWAGGVPVRSVRSRPASCSSRPCSRAVPVPVDRHGSATKPA